MKTEHPDLATLGIHSAYRVLAEHGLDGAGEAMQILMNEAMKIERDAHLGAGAYERTEQRKGYANGYKPKTMLTRMGSLTFSIPQVRDSDFYPSALERGTRVEQSVNLALAEMYVQGVSTRKVCLALQKLLGPDINVSSTQVSRAVEKLDVGLDSWRSRTLGETPYMLLDARYERVREGGQLRDCSVLIATGVTAEGRRTVLGVSVSLSEAEVHWRDFLQSLMARGLRGVKLITSDAHAGLVAARQAVLPSVPWQRCQFHLQQNAGQYVTRQDLKKGVASELRAIFNAETREEAERLLALKLAAWRASGQKALAEWAETNVPQGLNVFALPEQHRVRMRTTNMLERVNRELKRRTRVVSIFPNMASVLRLSTALLSEIDEDWTAGNIYLTPQTKT